MNDYLDGFQQADQKILDLLAPKQNEFESILDLGCGDGELTYKIAEACADVRVIGLDSESSEIQKAHNNRQNYHLSESSNIRFEEMDATQLSFTEEFDAVVSHRLIQ